MDLFNVIPPQSKEVPIIVSVPHAGIFFPDKVKEQLKPEAVENPDDTDWFVDKLYGFASEMGITMIVANYNRWVIDLNRSPQSKPLYNDGRVITDLVPITDFNGNNLYKNKPPTSAEIQFRIKNYYQPYHQKIAKLIQTQKEKFGKVLLLDAHSIRKIVPGIQKEPFPDLILGDNNQTTAKENIIKTAFQALKTDDYNLEHNHPFKGGQITRSFGNPKENIHTLQLEMAKINYMDDSEINYDNNRAQQIKKVLKHLFLELINELNA